MHVTSLQEEATTVATTKGGRVDEGAAALFKFIKRRNLHFQLESPQKHEKPKCEEAELI